MSLQRNKQENYIESPWYLELGLAIALWMIIEAIYYDTAKTTKASNV